jgi:phage terminase large subunit-like protein
MSDDKFRIAVEDMHALRAEIAAMSGPRREAFIAGLIESGAGSPDDWLLCARNTQIPPAGDWSIWMLMAGRGFGKTLSLSQAVHTAVRAGIASMSFVTPTAADCEAVNVRGPAGILRVGRAPAPRWVPSKKRLEWPNGATCSFYSGDEPDQLRGPQCAVCFIDELARMPKQTEVFDNAKFGLRLGVRPRMIIATTPRPTPLIKRLVKLDGTVLTTGTTYDNAANLPPIYLKQMDELYGGTRKGRQELLGELLLDPESALFRDEWIVRDPVKEELIEQVSVAVDPSGGADEVGIVVAALLVDGRLAVLADRSLKASTPAQWGHQVVKAHDEFSADDCCVEINFGGDMAADVIKQAAERAHQQGERDSNLIRIREVTASRGKILRAEPVSLMYEKSRVLHRPGLDLLESEMMSFHRAWDVKTEGSPNRLDALVHVLTRLSKIVVDLPIA